MQIQRNVRKTKNNKFNKTYYKINIGLESNNVFMLIHEMQKSRTIHVA